ncbi:MAG: anti-sigma factor domain-containing protein [Actinomycetota bacterium]
MTWNHDRVEELLAGFALGGLDPEDLDLAERALVEHVPECERCRRAFEESQIVAGDLALLAPAMSPRGRLPLRRRRRALPPRRPAWLRAAAAVLIFGLAGSTGVLARRLSDAEGGRDQVLRAISTLGEPGVSVIPMIHAARQQVAMIYVGTDGTMYFIATQMPTPEGVYQVWLFDNGTAWSPGTLELEDGTGVLEVPSGALGWDFLMVTDEPSGGSPNPTASPLVSAVLQKAPASPAAEESP